MKLRGESERRRRISGSARPWSEGRPASAAGACRVEHGEPGAPRRTRAGPASPAHRHRAVGSAGARWEALAARTGGGVRHREAGRKKRLCCRIHDVMMTRVSLACPLWTGDAHAFFLKKSLIFFMPAVFTLRRFLTPRLSLALRFFSSSSLRFFSARASSSSSSTWRLRE